MVNRVCVFLWMDMRITYVNLLLYYYCNFLYMCYLLMNGYVKEYFCNWSGVYLLFSISVQYIFNTWLAHFASRKFRITYLHSIAGDRLDEVRMRGIAIGIQLILIVIILHKIDVILSEVDGKSWWDFYKENSDFD